MSNATAIKQLKIKTGVVKRLGKDVTYYHKEITKEEGRLEQYRLDGKDDHQLRKQGEVVQESKMMVSDCTGRLRTAVDDLKKLMTDEDSIKETEEYKMAEEVLQEVAVHLS